MGFFSFVGKCALGAAAIIAAPVVLPAAAAAAGTAAAAAAAGAAAVGTAATAAVGTAAAAAGTAAAAVGSAATAAAGTAAAAAGTAASAVTGTVAAAGAKVAGAKAVMAAGAKVAATAGAKVVGGTVARAAAKEAVVTGAKIVGGAIVTGGVGYAGYNYVENAKDKAEARGREQGYHHGFREGELSAAQKFQQMLEENENLLFGMFATALYVARLDGEAKEEMDYIESCLGHENFLREEVKHEIQKIYQQKLNFYMIRTKYLDKVSFEELHYVDEIIREVMNADNTVSKEERNFYEKHWTPYYESVESENIGAPC